MCNHAIMPVPAQVIFIEDDICVDGIGHDPPNGSLKDGILLCLVLNIQYRSGAEMPQFSLNCH